MTSAAWRQTADSPDPSTEIRILGAITVRLGGQRIRIGDAKRRLMLAMLIAAEGRLISTALLINQIWGDRPPKTARDLIHAYASDIRRSLEKSREGAGEMLPRHHDGGYQFLAERDSVDLFRFRDLSKYARSLTERDDAQAVVLFRQALSQWSTSTRGNPGDGPLTDLNSTPVADCQWLKDYRQTLREEHHAALIACLNAELRLGEPGRLTAELTDLATASPPDEHIASLLMIAYYRSGRQAEASNTYRRTRDRLRTELGVEPGRYLKETHQKILNHDPSLDSLEPDHPNLAASRSRAAQAHPVPSPQRRPARQAPPCRDPEPNYTELAESSAAAKGSARPYRQDTDPGRPSENYLVGRTSEISMFEDLLARNGGRSVLNIYGPSGIGKSVVCWKLTEHSRGRGLLVGAADVSMHNSPVALLRELTHSMLARDPGVVSDPVHDFAEQLDEFDTVSEFVEQGGGIDKMFDAVGSPNDAQLLATLINEIGSTCPTTVRAMMRNRFALERYLRTAANRLGSSFTQALTAAQDEGGQTAVILLDTYEEVRTLDLWVRQTLIPGIPNGSRLVILGRNHLPKQNFDWADHADQIRTHLLPELAEDEAKAYLGHHGLSDPAALNEIYRFTGGYPLLLVLVRQLADGAGGWTAVGNLDQIGDRDMIASQLRILREERVHEVREVLEKCAIASWINPEIISTLLDVTPVEARNIYEKVRLHSFMERHPEGVRLHDKIRDLLIDRLRFTSRGDFDRLEKKLLAYHSAKVRS